MSTPLIVRHITDLSHAELVQLAPLVSKGAYAKEVLRAYKEKRRKPSPAMAIRIEKAGKKLGWLLPREAHAEGCDKCEFARACRKAQSTSREK